LASEAKLLGALPPPLASVKLAEPAVAQAQSEAMAIETSFLFIDTSKKVNSRDCSNEDTKTRAKMEDAAC